MIGFAFCDCHALVSGLWAVAGPHTEARAAPGVLPPFSSFPNPFSGVKDTTPTLPSAWFSLVSTSGACLGREGVFIEPSHPPKATGASWEGLWNPWLLSGLGLSGLSPGPAGGLPASLGERERQRQTDRQRDERHRECETIAVGKHSWKAWACWLGSGSWGARKHRALLGTLLDSTLFWIAGWLRSSVVSDH